MPMSLKNISMKNLNRYKALFFAIFLAFGALSQREVKKYPIVEKRDQDTVIIFKIDQGRRLAIINEERKKLIEVNAISEKQLSVKDSIINYQQNVINTYVSIESAQQVIIDQKNKQLELSDSQNKIINTELKKQKRYKLIAIISGISLNALTIWTMQKL